MGIIINGVEARLVNSQVARDFTGTKRTKFYEVAKHLDIKPIPHGKFSLWQALDVERIADFIEVGMPVHADVRPRRRILRPRLVEGGGGDEQAAT